MYALFIPKIVAQCLLVAVILSPNSVCPNQPKSLQQKIDKDFLWLDNYITAYHRTNGFTGTMLIAEGNKIVFQKAIGWQNISNDIANNINTRFNLGSGNKMFTAVAIAQLAEQGKLDYFSPIITYLPDYPDKAFASNATIHQLLTHSSGLGDFRDNEYKKEWHHFETLSERLPYVTNKPLLFTPGTGQAYSNSGFLVLGLIIEAVSGQNYFDYIRNNIYIPSGMLRSDSYKKNGEIKDLAIGYQGFKNEWYEVENGLMGTSAGGGFSTVDDILKFSKALYNNKLTTARSVKLLTTDKTPKGSKKSWDYGYGFIVRETNGTQLIGHGGRAAGVFFEYYYYPQLDYTFIMFSNSDAGSPEVLFNKINQYITDSDSKPEEAKSFVSEAESPFNVRLISKPNPADLLKDVTTNEPNGISLKKYSNISMRLIGAIHSKNLNEFNSYFANQDIVTKASNESMFNFMVDEAIPIKGRITQLHPISDPMEMKQSEFPVRVLVFHLEDGSPGSITFSLNDNGKVDHLSLFVHNQICINKVSQNCDMVEKQVD